MSSRAVLIAILCASCGNKSSVDPAGYQPPGSGSAGSAAPAGSGAGSAAPSKDPWVTADAAPDTPETRKARATAALGRVASIMPTLAKVRELTFDHDIPREYQSTDDFRKFVHAEITKELPEGKADDESAALFQLGLLLKPGNVAQLEEQAFVTQAGAYYDPEAKKFFLVMVPDSELVLDTISAHELTHGLQDQHFDLRKFMADTGPHKLDDDQQTVRRFIAEGDATFTMFLYAIASVTHADKLDARLMKTLRGQLEQYAAMSPEDMMKQNSSGFSTMDPDIKKSIDAMAEIPYTVLVPMVDSYMQGALLVADAFDRGGWPEVNALYANPPESTEQAMHPLTKLYPKRDHPHHATVAKLAGTELANLVFGELQWQIYFTLWVPDQKTKASEGWGGDRAIVTRRTDGRIVARIATTWDTPADADEFTAAYVASLAKRFPGAQGDALKDGVARPGGGKIFVKRDKLRVFVVDGADTAKDVDALAASTKFD
jgi:hypothetical protein